MGIFEPQRSYKHGSYKHGSYKTNSVYHIGYRLWKSDPPNSPKNFYPYIFLTLGKSRI